MRGKVAKMLRQLTAIGNTTYRQAKADYTKLNHKQKKELKNV